MDRWPASVALAIGRWRQEWRINREAGRFARQIYPALWENVRRKIAEADSHELATYAKVRAAQLAQEPIDALMLANPSLSGAFAARLIVRTAELAAKLAIAAAANARRKAA